MRNNRDHCDIYIYFFSTKTLPTARKHTPHVRSTAYLPRRNSFPVLLVDNGHQGERVFRSGWRHLSAFIAAHSVHGRIVGPQETLQVLADLENLNTAQRESSFQHLRAVHIQNHLGVGCNERL